MVKSQNLMAGAVGRQPAMSNTRDHSNRSTTPQKNTGALLSKKGHAQYDNYQVAGAGLAQSQVSSTKPLGSGQSHQMLQKQNTQMQTSFQN